MGRWTRVGAGGQVLATCGLAVAVLAGSACSGSPSHAVVGGAAAVAAAHPPAVAPTIDAAPSTTSTTAGLAPVPVPVPLVAWTGPVEHLFFHTLVVQPQLAFTRDRLGKGFRDFFVTEGEFRSMLEQLDANGWTLVDIHRVASGTVRVPAGRRPFVLSEDDVNYYDYEHFRGLGWRLVLDAAGAVKVELADANGGARVSDDDLVPILDAFVAAHPEFSADGAKGVLAVTGYQGVFGERVQDPSAPDHAAAVARAMAVAAALKQDGWVIASHSYGHIDLSKDSTAAAQRDTAHWKAVVEPIVGPTDVYIYPFGARPRAATFQLLQANGFTLFCDIDVRPGLTRGSGFVIMSRRHIDGIALTQQARALTPFFDVRTVLDRAARHL